MNNQEIREYLLDFQNKELPKLVNREIRIGKTKKIKAIIGPRRAGKTFLMYQKMKEMISSGTNKKDILYLNFEDPRLIDIGFKEINEIVKLHWQIFPSSKNIHIFIDEPQNVERWEIAVRSLHDEGLDVFLTGSSSKLMSKEIATSLRGRSLSYLLLPFSFREFLKMKDFSPNPNMLSSREKSILMNLLSEYLEFGGFPEITQESGENKLKSISEYFDMIVYRDIVERYKIKNTHLIKWLIKSIITSFASEFSVHKLYLILKSRGIKLSKNTLYSYLSMLQDAMFVFFLEKFDYSIRKRELSISKAYISDVGFTKIAEASKDIGKRMENVVFLELERRKSPLTSLFYWRDVQGKEVDFVLKERRIKQLIQVCHNIDDYDTKKRETRALLKASKELKCSNLLIITDDKECKERIKGKTIKYVPLWKWLLA